MAVSLCALLWPHPGMEAALISYEDEVLALVPDHSGRVQYRIRTDGSDGQPLEVQFFEFESEAALAGYLSDERRLRLSNQREAAILRTQLSRVTPA